MESFFKKHIEQAKAQQTASSTSLSTNNEKLIEWVETKRELKGIQSTQGKAEFKRRCLINFKSFLDGALQSEKLAEKDAQMFVSLLVWHIDAGLIAEAYDLSVYALKHKLSPPDLYNRTLPCLIAEEVADAVLKYQYSVEFAVLNEFVELLSIFDMYDQVRSKLYKATAQMCKDSHPEIALDYYKQALALNSAAGVKKDINALTKKLGVTPDNTSDASNDEKTDDSTESESEQLPDTTEQ